MVKYRPIFALLQKGPEQDEIDLEGTGPWT